jgi:hypothetical protein
VNSLAAQASHYAAVRARLWAASPHAEVIVEPPYLPTAPLPDPDEHLMWTTPLILEVGAESLQIASVLDALRCRPFVTVRLVANIVALAFDVSTDEIFSELRRPRIVRPRQIAMAIAHHYLRGRVNGTYPAIGRAFDRDHTTVLHAVRKYRGMVEKIAAANAAKIPA